jgi:hypothetical protein
VAALDRTARALLRDAMGVTRRAIDAERNRIVLRPATDA